MFRPHPNWQRIDLIFWGICYFVPFLHPLRGVYFCQLGFHFVIHCTMSVAIICDTITNARRDCNIWSIRGQHVYCCLPVVGRGSGRWWVIILFSEVLSIDERMRLPSITSLHGSSKDVCVVFYLNQHHSLPLRLEYMCLIYEIVGYLVSGTCVI